MQLSIQLILPYSKEFKPSRNLRGRFLNKKVSNRLFKPKIFQLQDGLWRLSNQRPIFCKHNKKGGNFKN